VVLALAMVISGSCITILIKLQDMVRVEGPQPGEIHEFRHPLLQTSFMFLGEILCFVIPSLASYGYDTGRQTHPAYGGWIIVRAFAVPALCDVGATTLINLGLFYTSASTYQMLKGNVVCFAGIWTICLLQKRLKSQHWMGIVMITAGAALVGASGLGIGHHATGEHPLGGHTGLGIALILAAQVLNSLQFIVEEKFMKSLKPSATVAVGVEGVFGLACCLAALPCVSTFLAPDGKPIDQIGLGIWSIQQSKTLQLTTLALIVNVAVFNLSGISVTRQLSGTARSVFDVSRTVIVWMVGIGLGWESFHTLQAIGFGILVAGTSVYNDILRSCIPDEDEEEDGLSSCSSSVSESTSSYSDSEENDMERSLLQRNYEESDATSFRATRPMHVRQPPQWDTMARSISMLPEILSPKSL